MEDIPFTGDPREKCLMNLAVKSNSIIFDWIARIANLSG
jgi:hypothetical protein